MNSTVLITGASSGLGRELAKIFAARGCDLVLVARREERLMELKRELEKNCGVSIFPLAVDLAASDASETITAFVARHNLSVDMLINNAGLGALGEFVDTDFSRIEQMYKVNVLAPVNLMHAFLPQMIKNKRGHIVNISSIAAFFPGPLMAVYFATKASLVSLTEAMERELQGHGIKFTVACPGPFRTEFQEVSGNQETKHMPSAQQMASKISAGIINEKRLIIPYGFYKLIYLLRWALPRDVWGKFIYVFHKRQMASHRS